MGPSASVRAPSGHKAARKGRARGGLRPPGKQQGRAVGRPEVLCSSVRVRSREGVMWSCGVRLGASAWDAVSYTHLTLPTIC
eukprot:8760092-Alexandrium_andersonii.AAC.1